MDKLALMDRATKSTLSSLMFDNASVPTWYHNLPIPILIRIFQYFCEVELKNLMLVCQQWKYAAQNPVLWKELVIRGNHVPIYFICKKIRCWTQLETLHVDDILEPTTVIRQVCRCIPGIKHLAIRHCSPIPESAVRFIIKCCTHLESLDFSGTQIKGSVFYKELAGLTKLKKLNLSSNPYLTTKNLITAVLNCRNLNDLRVSKYLCSTESLRDDDAILILVIFNCRKLQRLGLYGATNLYGEQFASMWKHFPKLTQLKITNAYQIGDGHVVELFEKGKSVMKNMILLDFSGCWKITEKSVGCIIKTCDKLQKLSLKSCKSVSNVQAVCTRCPTLKVLNVAFMKQLRLETLFPLPPALETLFIDENEKILGWLKSLIDDMSRLRVNVCLSEYNKTMKPAELN